MRRSLVIPILILASFYGGCSYSTDYVIVNSSGAPVQVTYTIAPTTIDPLVATGVVPSMLPSSELNGREWSKLSATEFVFDRAKRAVTVSLPLNQGLLITRVGDYNPNPPVAEKFIIEEIRIAGANGEMILKGNAVSKAFVVVPKPFYHFGPTTLLKLTYTGFARKVGRASFSVQPLCSLCLCGSLFLRKNNHRVTENTEVAQRNRTFRAKPPILNAPANDGMQRNPRREVS